MQQALEELTAGVADAATGHGAARVVPREAIVITPAQLGQVRPQPRPRQWRALRLGLCGLAELYAGAIGSPLRAQGSAVTFPGPQGGTLRGVLYRPSGSGPFPAVVALHGCGGLNDRDGRLNARYADWGERLSAQGFLVLLPDSFGSRGLGSQCGTAERQVRPTRERVADAYAAKASLQARADVNPHA